MATVRTIHDTVVAYFEATSTYPTIPELISDGRLPACLADVSWRYRFRVDLDDDGFTIRASPADRLGRYSVYAMPDGVVRFAPGGIVTPQAVGQPVR